MFKAEVTIITGITRIVVLLVLSIGCSGPILFPDLPSVKSVGDTSTASSPPASVTINSQASRLSESARLDDQQNAAVQAQRPEGDAVETAMAGFIEALQKRDTKGFLAFFSDKTSLRYLGTVETPYRTELVRYTELVRDLVTKERDGGWYVRLFDAGPDAAFSYFADKNGGRSWKRVNENKFVPPDGSANSAVFVTWRKYQGRWVVQSIGDPNA
jgi:hypothetical protein